MKSSSSQDAKHNYYQLVFKVVEKTLLVLAGIIVLLLLFGIFWPLNTNELTVTEAATSNYDQAKRDANAYIKKDTDNPAINPDCYPVLMDHGFKTDKVLVISHGYTSCPRQFKDLARQFYDKGYNVFITRIPQHGYKDLMTDALKDLDAKDMLASTNQAVDIAQGLGDKVDLMGLSMGGPLVAWIGQNRSDINNTVAIDPMFSIYFIDGVLQRPVTGLLDGLPNTFIWWNNELKENLPGPGYTYPRFGTKGMGQALLFTVALDEIIDDGPAKTKQLTIITNGNDKTVSNQLTNKLVRRWREADSNVVTYEFPASDKINHDLIDPFQGDANIELSYPRIIELTDLSL